ncbi:MAG TPA: hypothetical protein VLZ07_08390 [Syntrophales bacterium]|nr:hypothetical protein [Syntrophales bacterium]
MKRNVCLFLWIALLCLSFCGALCFTELAAASDFQPSTVLELKNIGVMIGRGAQQDKYLPAWKQLVAGSKNMDINRAINIVTDEAKREAGQNMDRSRARVQKYNEMKKIIAQELNSERAILSRSGGRIQPFQRNVYVIERGNPDKFGMQKGNVINSKQELQDSIKDLEDKMDTVGDDSQLANVDMQSALQKQQQTLQMLSTISKLLYDTAMAVIRKIGS